MTVVGQIARFGAVGVSNTLLTALTYAALRSVALQPLLAAPLAFAVGAVNGYTWNGRWTFRSRDSSFLRYAVVQVAAVVATELLLALGAPYVVALSCATAVGFAGCRRWAFAH